MQTNAATYFEPRKHYSYLPTNKDSLGPGFLTYKFRVRIAPSQRDDCQIQHRYLPGYIQRRIAMIMYTYVCIDIYARVCRCAYTSEERIGRGSLPEQFKKQGWGVEHASKLEHVGGFRTWGDRAEPGWQGVGFLAARVTGKGLVNVGSRAQGSEPKGMGGGGPSRTRIFQGNKPLTVSQARQRADCKIGQRIFP